MRTACLAALAATVLGCASRAAVEAPPPTDVAVDDSNISLRTADGLAIAATYWPPISGTTAPAPVVVAVPTYGRGRESYAPMVGPITERGMGFLALDLRGHEDRSKRVESHDASTFDAMRSDVEAAVAWLAKEKKTPKGRIGLLGAGVGCGAAIEAAVRNADDVDAVVCLASDKFDLDDSATADLERWPAGKPLLAVVGADDGGGLDSRRVWAKLGSRVVETRVVGGETPDVEATDLRGADMLGRVPQIESNIADWFAYRLAFRRIDLGDGAVAVVGSTGDSLYVGVEAADASTPAIDQLAVRIGTGDVTDPWSKAETIELGRQLVGSARMPTRRRTRLARKRLGVPAGRPFAVAVTLDGKKFLPDRASPPLFFTLR